MAKLYAELTSDKCGRTVSKGGEKYIETKITHKGRPLWRIQASASGALHVTHNGKTETFNSLNW